MSNLTKEAMLAQAHANAEMIEQLTEVLQKKLQNEEGGSHQETYRKLLGNIQGALSGEGEAGGKESSCEAQEIRVGGSSDHPEVVTVTPSLLLGSDSPQSAAAAARRQVVDHVIITH
jgi:hypothetical protein